MKLPLEIFGIIFHLDKAEHVEGVLEESSGFHSLGTGVKILGQQKHKPHQFAVKKGQSKGKHEQD